MDARVTRGGILLAETEVLMCSWFLLPVAMYVPFLRFLRSGKRKRYVDVKGSINSRLIKIGWFITVAEVDPYPTRYFIIRTGSQNIRTFIQIYLICSNNILFKNLQTATR